MTNEIILHSGVEYIRKDIYDDLDKSYFKLHETSTGHSYGLYCDLEKAQARIKELEDILDGVLGIKLNDGTLLAEKVLDACKALEKESV